jgi:hypothetical protein
MPINVTPISGLSDRSSDARSHTGRGDHERMVTSESLRSASRSNRGPGCEQRILAAMNVLHHYEKNESWGSDG